MKSIKYIITSAFVTLSVFGAVIYSSCSKDTCGAVTCLNKGTCSGGLCMCTEGIGGNNCETIYRNKYAYVYSGNASFASSVIDSAYVNFIDTNNTLSFAPTNDTTNYNTMMLTWRGTGSYGATMAITLSNNNSAGSNFTIEKTVVDTVYYTGSGTVSSNSASLTLKEWHRNSPSIIISLHNFTR